MACCTSRVLNPERASYGIGELHLCHFATRSDHLRSEVGKIELDRTFEERTNINTAVVSELDKATEPWGIKVMRYEIKNITPPHDVLAAMEKQMRAEREKRALILTSEGVRDAADQYAPRARNNRSSKLRKPTNNSRSTKPKVRPRRFWQLRVRRQRYPQGRQSIQGPGGFEAVQLRVADNYLTQFGKLAQQGNTMILPATLSDVGSMISLAMNVIKQQGRNNGAAEKA